MGMRWAESWVTWPVSGQHLGGGVASSQPVWLQMEPSLGTQGTWQGAMGNCPLVRHTADWPLSASGSPCPCQGPQMLELHGHGKQMPTLSLGHVLAGRGSQGRNWHSPAWHLPGRADQDSPAGGCSRAASEHTAARLLGTGTSAQAQLMPHPGRGGCGPDAAWAPARQRLHDAGELASGTR